MHEQPKVRVVTPEQYQQDYLELTGMFVTPRKFRLIRKLEDGNYLVREPERQSRPAFG